MTNNIQPPNWAEVKNKPIVSLNDLVELCNIWNNTATISRFPQWLVERDYMDINTFRSLNIENDQSNLEHLRILATFFFPEVADQYYFNIFNGTFNLQRDA